MQKLISTLVLTLAALTSLAAPPQLAPPTLTSEGVALEWSPGDTSSYTVQWRDQLGDGLWLAAPAPFPWPLATNRWVDARPVEATRFYRVLAVTPAERGKILSTNLLGSYSVATLQFVFQLGGVPITPQYAVTAVKLDYETVDPWGNRTQASGVVVVPQTGGKSWPLASYQHGTLAKKSEAPSANSTGERVLGLAFATSGYVGVLPDYLGLGDSPGTQPYHHAHSEGTAGVDMLRAARAFCAHEGIALNDQLFLIGYSHGGHATMALMRELETFHADEFTVTAAAPMAGAYDLSGVTADDFLSPRPKPNPYYSALLLAGFQSVYGLAPSLADLFVPPYDQTLPPLLDGSHTGSEINAAMPADPTQVLKPEYLAAFKADPNHPLRQALRDNDVYQWKPKAPLRLYHCLGDQDVPFANSQVAYDAFVAAGVADVKLIDLDPAADHGACSEPSLLDAKLWFDSLKQ